MRHRSLLAALRGKDGRSLARALVLLVLVSLFAGGLDAGAAADGRTVICAADRGGRGTPPSHVAADCCVAGLVPLGMALATAPPVPPAPPVAAQVFRPAAAAAPHAALPHPVPLARGPPLPA